MPNKATPATGVDTLFESYDSVSHIKKSIRKKKKNAKKYRGPPSNASLPMLTVDDGGGEDGRDSLFDYDAGERDSNLRYMGMTSDMDQDMLEATFRSSRSSLPWFMEITNERVRDELLKLSREKFTCVECHRDVIELNNRGRWECSMRATWRPAAGTIGQFKEVRMRIPADHRMENDPPWTNPHVSTTAIQSSILAVMDPSSRPVPRAICPDYDKDDNSETAANIRNAALQSKHVDTSATERIVRSSKRICRYDAMAMETVNYILTFYTYETDPSKRNANIRKEMARVFDMSKAKKTISLFPDADDPPLYVLKKEMD